MKEQFTRRKIAITGIGCRLPGHVFSAGDLWELLKTGTDAISVAPINRWGLASGQEERFPHLPPLEPLQGGFLDDISSFDASFFGISPREVASMDPQQRLLLQVVWEAFENAGEIPAQLKQSRTGVYMGCFALDYKLETLSRSRRDEIDVHTMAGVAATMLANRISWWFDLRGPCMNLDTACSSSLIATHLAVQSLMNGEVDRAVVGGVNLIFNPDWTIATAKGGFLAPDGRCKAFSELANGYVRSEGAAVVVMKPLEQALKDGDRIYALISGSASNQDGHSTGITVPSEEAQISLMKEAYERAGIEPREVQYVEAHGTGTRVGDPIEVRAIGAVLGKGRDSGEPCLVGSIKSNLGHLEAAAGVAGLVKAALVLHHGMVPPNLHFSQPNKKIAFDELGLRVPVELVPLPIGRTGQYAGVNSFGFGGSNAHVVLERYCGSEVPSSVGSPVHVLPISAASQTSLRRLAQDYASLLGMRPKAINDICFTAATRRTHFGHRLAAIGSSAEELATNLEEFALEGACHCASVGAPGGPPKTVWVFSGMGQQRAQMGMQLFESQPVFRESLLRVDAELYKLNQCSVVKELQRSLETSCIDRTEIAQPALFAIQIALAELWMSRGIVPQAVVGHSVGEVAACYVAGILDLTDAVKVIYHRSRLQARTEGSGSMLAVGLSEADTLDILKRHGIPCEVAAVNSGRSVTLAGDVANLSKLSNVLQSENVFHRHLNVEVPYHSRAMAPLREELLESLSRINPSQPRIPFYSSVQGQPFLPSDLSAAYWYDNVRNQVNFAGTINELLSLGFELFVEVSAHPVLATSLRELITDAGSSAAATSTLVRGRDEYEAFLQALGELYARGINPDWAALYPRGGQIISLPPYAWDNSSFWLSVPHARKRGVGRSPAVTFSEKRASHFLGEELEGVTKGWNIAIDDETLEILQGHRVYASALFPAAAYVDIALASSGCVHPEKDMVVEDLVLHEALFLSVDEAPFLQISYSSSLRKFSIYKVEADGEWRKLVTGKVAEKVEARSPNPIALSAILAQCPLRIGTQACYDSLSDIGINYGDAFQKIEELFVGSDESIARVSGINPHSSANFCLEPTSLDACFQVLLATVVLGGARAVDSLFLPVRIGKIVQFGPFKGELWAHARVKAINSSQLIGDITITGEEGNILVLLENFVCRRLAESDTRDSKEHPWLYDYRWQPVKTNDLEIARERQRFVVIASEAQSADKLCAQLERQGHSSVVFLERTILSSPEALEYGPNREEITSFFETLPSAITDIIYIPGTSGLPSGPVDLMPYAEQSCFALLNVLKARWKNNSITTARLTIITRGIIDERNSSELGDVTHALLWGIARVARNEYVRSTIRLLDCSEEHLDERINLLAAVLIDQDRQRDELLLREGEILEARLSRASAVNLTADVQMARPTQLANPYMQTTLCLQSAGSLDNLRFERLHRRKPAVGEVEIEITAAGLNYKDVAKCLGLMSDADFRGCFFEPGVIGFEASGRVVALGPGVNNFAPGDEVVGFVPSAIGSHAITDARLIAKIPSNVSPVEIAGVPVTYLTATYSLVNLARIKSGERVLIHAAAGGVGTAAVQIAKHLGAEVFGTAGTVGRREFLRDIGVDHVLDSRSLAFVSEIKHITNGQGVDVILNSLVGEPLIRSMECLSDFGRFVEIGKQDIFANTALGLKSFDKSISFMSFDLDRFLGSRTAEAGEIFRNIIGDFADRKLKPLKTAIFQAKDSVEGIRRLSKYEILGKAVIQFDQGSGIEELTQDQFEVSDEGAYLITGGNRGFGFAIAQWLASRGARRLILLSRNPARDEDVKAAIGKLRADGITVSESFVDVTNQQALSTEFQSLAKGGECIKGIFHAANVYDDAVIENLDMTRFSRAVGPKAFGAWNLHCVSRHLNLDIFLLCSSIVSLTGNAGQTSYSAANAFLNNLASLRRKMGLPAQSVCFGALANTGYLARNEDVAAQLDDKGIRPMMLARVFQLLEYTLKTDVHSPVIANIRWNKWAESHAAARATRFSRLLNHESSSGEEMSDGNRTALEDIKRSNEPAVLIEKSVRELAARVLRRHSPADLDSDVSFQDMGMDSMLALEMKNLLERTLELTFPVTLIFKYPTVSKLVEYLTEEVGSKVQLVGADAGEFPLNDTWIEGEL